jgi:hypothetical protein
MKQISEESLKHWREHGYAVVHDCLTPEELAAAQKELYSTFPSLEDYQHAPSLYRNDYCGGHARHLPFLGDVLNFVAVNPKIVSFADCLHFGHHLHSRVSRCNADQRFLIPIDVSG